MVEKFSTKELRGMVTARKTAKSDPTEVKYVERREKTVGWVIMESPLIKDNNAYTDLSFDRDFFPVTPRGYIDIQDYIEKTLSPKGGKAIGLELGGTGSRLFGGFMPGFFERTAGVSITDFRDFISPSLKILDEEQNHRVITGDLVAKDTKERIEEFLDGQKADLIISRMAGGLGSLPRQYHVIGAQADYWYQQLATGGIMFTQVPPAIKPSLVKEWEEMVNSEYKGRLEVQSSEGIDHIGIAPVRIRKLEDAPAKLPLIRLYDLKH